MRKFEGHVPQVIVTLTPDGLLAVELPSRGPTRHKVELRTGNAEAALRVILEAQARGEYEIGQDGAPTQAQVKHWERHAMWPDDRCRFCIAEGRVANGGRKRVRKSQLIAQTAVREGKIEIRRLTEVRKRTASSGNEKIEVRKSMKELGL